MEKLSQISQEHILQYWSVLSPTEKSRLLHDIENLDIETFKLQQKLLKTHSQHTVEHIDPFTDFSNSGNSQDISRGHKIISQGHVGCLMVAGGQGTRLGFSGPKGLFPITSTKQKTLFQLFAEKTLAASKQANRKLYLAVMTSPLNHEQTVRYFEENNRFGLSEKQLSFFSQDTLPFLDENGNLFLESRDQIAEGPNGNGLALKHFVEQGLWNKWHADGIRYLNFIMVDNPLADPFDAELIGFHEKNHLDVTIKCTNKRNAAEKVGVLAKNKGKTCVVEYSEMPNDERDATNPDGSLKYACANIGLFCFSMDFIRRLYDEKLFDKMPLHKAFKSAQYLNAEGQERQSEKPIAWKFEKFIFDILPYSKRTAALLYPREECFAPLKNGIGPDSIAEVQAMLQQQARQTLERITGTTVPKDRIIELAQEFYYPTQELLTRWKGKRCPDSPYIE